MHEKKLMPTVENNTLERFVNHNITGYLLLVCTDKDHVRAETYNSLFRSWMEKDMISMDEIIHSGMINCVISGKSEKSYSYLHEQGDASFRYFVKAVPIISDNRVERVVVTLISESGRNDPLIQVNLSPRERDVVNLVGQGYTNKYIACTLHISEGTVKKILYNSYRKLSVTSRVEMINLLHKSSGRFL